MGFSLEMFFDEMMQIIDSGLPMDECICTGNDER